MYTDIGTRYTSASLAICYVGVCKLVGVILSSHTALNKHQGQCQQGSQHGHQFPTVMHNIIVTCYQDLPLY